MSTWQLVQLLQAAILIGGLSVGVFVLKLRPIVAFIATLLMLPAPILKVSPGTAGFIYLTDLLAAAIAVNWFINARKRPLPFYVSLPIQRIASGLLFLLPIISTIFAYFDTSVYRNTKYVLLSHARALGYLIIFLAFARIIQRVNKPDAVLVLQIILFSFVAICGLVQYGLGLNLDLWNEVNRIDSLKPDIGEFGGGMMGLYRGAVGAWGAGILAIASAVLPLKKYGSALLAIVIVICHGIMISVGSRQGVIIGSVILVFGLWRSSEQLKLNARTLFLLRSLAGLVLAVILALTGFWRTDDSRFQQFAANRYAPLISFERLRSEIVDRDAEKRRIVIETLRAYPNILLSGVGYGTDAEVSGGRALFYLDSEILMLLQSNGAIFLLLYIYFLYRIHKNLKNTYKFISPSKITFANSAILALYTGLLLMWGHFFLMNIGPNQAPVAYWNWALFGGAIGLCSRNILGKNLGHVQAR